MPIAYLIIRFLFAICAPLFTWLTLSTTAGDMATLRALHWLRAFIVPVVVTSTSAVLGYRALIVHLERPRLISFAIHTLLFAELVGGMLVMTLAVADTVALEIRQRLGAKLVYISPAWIVAPLVIALVIDAIFTLIVVIPILRRDERPRKGEVIHLLLSNAIFFGLFSFVVKAIAIGVTLCFTARNTNPYLPVRVESVASAIFACRIFRGQETFLSTQKEKKADPRLKTIEVDVECAPTASGTVDVEKGAETIAKGEVTQPIEEVEKKVSVESRRCKATVMVSECCADEGSSGDELELDKAVNDRLCESLLAQ